MSEILSIKMLLIIKCFIGLLLILINPRMALAGGGGGGVILDSGVEVVITPESTPVVLDETTNKLKYWPWALLLLAFSYTGYQWLQENKK